MYLGYRTIFWGLFLSTFHINFGPIQILPAFVGWMIVAHGIHLLYEAKSLSEFQEARLYSIIIVIISAAGIIIDWSGIDYAIFSYLPIVVAVFELLVIYYVLSGSSKCLDYAEDKENAVLCERILRNYMIFFIINTLLEILAITLMDTNLLLLSIFIGLLLIIKLLFIIDSLKKLNEITI